MNLTGKPNAEDITKLGDYYKDDRWSRQSQHDKLMVSYVTMQNEVEPAKGKGHEGNVKGFRSGLGDRITYQDAVLLVANPKIRFNPPDPENEKDKKYVNEILEPAMHGAWHQSQQAGGTWRRLSQPLIALDRAWDNILPHPHLWARTEVSEIVDRLDSEKDPGKRDDLRKKIKMAKSTIWPIRWTYVPTQGTWTTFDSEYWLPEVIECRKMRLKDIADRWGEDAVPGPKRKGDYGTNEHDVYIYANHQWHGVIVPDKEDPRLAAEFEHKFGRSPYDCAINRMLIENETGVVFPGALFNVRWMIDAIDEIMADYRENHRENARNLRYVHVGKREDYDEGQLVGGRPQPITIEDGMALFEGEGVNLFPIVEIGPEKYQYLLQLKDMAAEASRSAVLRGQLLSGTSQNAFTTAYQVAERELEPPTMALAQLGKSAINRFLLSARRLGEAVPIHTDKGMIEISPDDWVWSTAAQVQMSRTIPIDQSILAAVAERWLGMGIAPETVFEQILNIENPALEERRARLAQIRAAIHENVVIPKIIERLQTPAPVTPEQAGQLEQMMGQASPDLQQFIAGNFGDQIPGNVLQALANEGRAGLPQQPQVPGEVTGGMPVVAG